MLEHIFGDRVAVVETGWERVFGCQSITEYDDADGTKRVHP